tara:strand:- start:1349 stop:1726 length:378 start_codon:yes stop_codon:yes gene_type:complete
MRDKIIRYEKARQLVKELGDKRHYLLNQCEGLDTSEDNHGMIVEIGHTCGVEAWNCMTDNGDERGTFCSFEDAFFNEIYDEEGACDKCIEAFKIKHHSLSDAKKEFGAAKRSLSFLGKKLIKEGK